MQDFGRNVSQQTVPQCGSVRWFIAALIFKSAVIIVIRQSC